MKKNEAEKITRYRNLTIEIQRIWIVEAIVVHEVIGALGETSSTETEKHLMIFHRKHDVRAVPLLKTALCGSVHFLKKVIYLPVHGRTMTKTICNKNDAMFKSRSRFNALQ